MQQAPEDSIEACVRDIRTAMIGLEAEAGNFLDALRKRYGRALLWNRAVGFVGLYSPHGSLLLCRDVILRQSEQARDYWEQEATRMRELLAQAGFTARRQ